MQAPSLGPRRGVTLLKAVLAFQAGLVAARGHCGRAIVRPALVLTHLLVMWALAMRTVLWMVAGAAWIARVAGSLAAMAALTRAAQGEAVTSFLTWAPLARPPSHLHQYQGIA